MYTPLTGNIKIELFWKAYVELFHDTHIKEKHFQQICTCNMVSTELWCYFMLQESSFIFLKLQDEKSQDSYKGMYGFSSVCAQIRQPCMHKNILKETCSLSAPHVMVPVFCNVFVVFCGPRFICWFCCVSFSLCVSLTSCLSLFFKSRY